MRVDEPERGVPDQGDDLYHERRKYERRAGIERRGVLRWDPRAAEKERRSGNDRRRLRPGYMRQ